MDETLIRLIGQLQELAPSVWDIAIKQVDVEVQARLLWRWPSFILLGLAVTLIIILLVWAIRFWYEEPVGQIMSIIFLTVLSVVGFFQFYQICFIDVMKMQQNPHYYAIKLLTEAIKAGTLK